MANTVVRARFDEHVKEEAAAAPASNGLTVSDAFRLIAQPWERLASWTL